MIQSVNLGFKLVDNSMSSDSWGFIYSLCIQLFGQKKEREREIRHKTVRLNVPESVTWFLFSFKKARDVEKSESFY